MASLHSSSHITTLPPQTIPQTTLPTRTLSDFNSSHQYQTPSSTSQTQTTTYPSTTPSQALNMHSRRRNNAVVVEKTTKPTLMTRLRGRHAKTRTVKTTTKVEPTHHHQTRSTKYRANESAVHHRRHASIGDKISGAMMKLKGSITRRPGVKAAGTRRMHGTDGRGSHRTY